MKLVPIEDQTLKNIDEEIERWSSIEKSRDPRQLSLDAQERHYFEQLERLPTEWNAQEERQNSHGTEPPQYLEWNGEERQTRHDTGSTQYREWNAEELEQILYHTVNGDERGGEANPPPYSEW